MTQTEKAEFIIFKTYAVYYRDIAEPIIFIARSIDVALLDAIAFYKNKEINIIAIVSDKVHIDFKRENDAIAEWIKP